MTYVTYDPETGQVTYIGSTEPEDLDDCFITEESLEEDFSKYLVQNGTLYSVQEFEEVPFESETEYYIVYDRNGLILEVTSEKPEEGTSYIGVSEYPGDLTGKLLNNFTVTAFSAHGKGYVDSVNDLPASDNEVADFYVLRDGNRTKYIWNGLEWILWDDVNADNAKVWVATADDLPDDAETYDLYYVRDTLKVYEMVETGEWLISNVMAMPRAVSLSGNSFRILTAIVAEPAGTPSASPEETIGSSIDNLSDDTNGQDIIVTITLNAGNWAVRSVEEVNESEEDDTTEADNSSSLRMVYVVASDYIRHNTILQINGINRGALRGDMEWTCDDGYITFSTDYGLDPYEDVEIFGVFHSTTDAWNAHGIINAWPQGEWRKVQYQQSANVPNWSIDIRAGDSVLIETPLNMTFARLLYISPEWCGNTHAFLTQYYVGSGNHKLYLRITNLATQPIRINDILLSIIYSGNVVNFIAPNGLAEEDSASTVSSEGATDTYITDEDIDEVT